MVVVAEYIWIDANQGLRSKSKVIHGKDQIKSVKQLPNWNFDGSSTGQAPGDDSEVILRPCVFYPDPFRKGNNILVMCDCYTPAMVPIKTNTRAYAMKEFLKNKKEATDAWFGIEQEYVLFKEGSPVGWPTDSKARTFAGPTGQYGYPGPQGPYYCGAGADVAAGREVAERHLQCCLFAGINVSGINTEVMLGQHEFQVGPCPGISAGDELMTARYILMRVCEEFGVVASFEPKPIPGDVNGSGLHTNFSTKKMRAPNGLKKAIIPAIEALGKKHQEHIAVYGEGNELRLTGNHETQSIDQFSYGIADRGASIRIGNQTAVQKRGYLEDRRPASNADPYLVTGKIFETTVNGAKKKGFSLLRFSRGPRTSLKKAVGSK